MVEPRIETELWTSFVTLLRSYAAAAGFHTGVVEVRSSMESVTIGALAVELEMRFDAALGRVTWQKRVAREEAKSGRFQFLPEGTIAIDGTTKDLDHVAIDFIALVTERAKGGSR
jgi:hypothetical protein